ncbi:MAG TPA: TonB family protein [Longimicrobiales bacterium]
MRDQARRPVQADGSEMFGHLVASRPQKERKGAIASTAGSVVLHVMIIAGLVYATSRVAAAPPTEALTPISLKAPPDPILIQPPPMADVPAPVASAPAARGFIQLPMPDVIPPSIPAPTVGITIRPEDFTGRGVPGGRGDGDPAVNDGSSDISSAPAFVPFDQPPRLKNAKEVETSISRNYPTTMRDAGIAGTTTMWFYIDETGRAVKYQVFKSSGFAALDSAAAKVADVMEFFPAQVQDRKVSVWVQVPIVFRIQ